MPFSQTLLPEFEEEMKNTRRMLERVPDGKFEYSPHTKSMNLAQLASHVAEVPTWVPYMIAQDEFDMPSDFKPDVVSTRAELLEMFDKGVVQAREHLGPAKAITVQAAEIGARQLVFHRDGDAQLRRAAWLDAVKPGRAHADARRTWPAARARA